jgi:hypothetical protein
VFADLQDVDEEEAAAQRRAERQRREQEVDDLDDDDEFADFLDDDEDAGDGRTDGEPRRRRRAALARALPSGVSAEAFQVSWFLHMEAHPACRSGARHMSTMPEGEQDRALLLNTKAFVALKQLLYLPVGQ